MITLFKWLINSLRIESDNDVFDKTFDNKEDVLLFDKTILELKKSNNKSKTITLKNGSKIIVTI